MKKLDELTAGDVVPLSAAESTALSAVTEHVTTRQSTDLITGDLLTVGSAIHV